MSKRKTAIVALAAVVCGAVSFLDARQKAMTEQDEAGGHVWLRGASADTVELEKGFETRLEQLKSDLIAEQGELASALEDPCMPNAAVLEHTEKVITAHERLMREVGEHVVRLGGELSLEARRSLMGSCADTVRGPMCRMGGGAGMGMRNGGGRGYGYRRGGGGGPRDGSGYGMRMRGMNRLARRLNLDEEQSSLLSEKDPDFEADSANLRNALMAEREKLLEAFENPPSSENDLLGQIEKMVAAQSKIERRIAEHVLVVRPYLTVEQQKWLIGLCSRR